MLPPNVPCPAHDGNHCLHYQEGDGNCCDCLKPLAHCHECGWAGEQTADPAADHNLCPTCANFLLDTRLPSHDGALARHRGQGHRRLQPDAE